MAKSSFIRIGAVSCILALIGLQLPLGLLARYGPATIHQWLTVAPLMYEPPIPELISPTATSLESGDFQRTSAEWFARIIYPRDLVVKLTNQAYYDMFSVSYMHYGQMVIGRKRALFEKAYITTYCSSNDVRSVDFSPIAAKLRV